MKHVLLILFLFLISCSDEPELSMSDIPSPIDGINYYQLEQVDYDGKTEKHGIFIANKDTDFTKSNGRLLSTYTSQQNGEWSDFNTWGDNVPTTLPKESTITVRDTISVDELNFAKDCHLIIESNGYLFANSITSAKDFKVTVNTNSTLAVVFDLTAAKDSEINTDGIIAVGGNIDLGNNGVINNPNETLYVCGVTNTDPVDNEESTCSDLSDDSQEVYNNIQGSPLPITLLYQRASLQKDGSILIEYETATEINSDYVVINWSINGINWLPLDSIPSKNEPSRYVYIHK